MLRDYFKVLRVTGGGWKYAILILLRSPVDIMFTWTQASFLQRAFNAVGQTGGARLTPIRIIKSHLILDKYLATQYNCCKQLYR